LPGVDRYASVLFQTRVSHGTLGANVGANNSCDAASANEVVDSTQRSGPRAVAMRADIGTASDIEELFAASLKGFGRLAWVTITIETTPRSPNLYASIRFTALIDARPSSQDSPVSW
jgi:hypothetical protein